MAFACYVEIAGYMKIGLYGSRITAEKNTADPSKIAEVNAAKYSRHRLPTYFTARDQSYPELRGLVERAAT